MTISERIKKVRTSLGMSQEKFGAQLGTSRDAINNAENGRAEIKETLIKLICKEFNVEYEWIKTGNGSMFHQSSDDDIPAMVDELMASENDTAKAVFRAFTQLDEDDWKVVAKIIDLLGKK